MSDSTTPQSENVVDEVFNTGSSGVTFAGALLNLVKPGLDNLSKSWGATKRIKDTLGIWEKEALAAGGAPRSPVLDGASFEKHLIDFQGQFVPIGTCPSSRGWRQFLHALRIQPGMNVVQWKPQTGGSATADIDLELDGTVLYHLINLYTKEQGKTHSSRFDGEIDLVFGGLFWTQENEQKVVLKFAPGPDVDAVKTPLKSVRNWFRPESPIITNEYFEALQWGTSMPALRFPSSEATMATRAQSLVKNISTMRHQRCLVTDGWLRQAMRIRRKVLQDGDNKDLSFYRDLCEVAASFPNYNLPASFFWGCSLQENQEADLSPRERDAESKTFFFCQPPVSVRRRRESPARTDDSKVLKKVLEHYEHESSGSWKRDLFELGQMDETLLEIAMFMRPELYTKNLGKYLRTELYDNGGDSMDLQSDLPLLHRMKVVGTLE